MCNNNKYDLLMMEITFDVFCLIASLFSLSFVTASLIVDGENQDLTENGAEDDMEKEVNDYNGWHGDSAAAADTDASVNAARVAVSSLTASYFQ